MTRKSGLLMGAGSAAVIVALVALWTAIHDDPAAAQPTEHGHAEPGAPTAPEASHAPGATAARPAQMPASSVTSAPALRAEDVSAANRTPAADEPPVHPLDNNEGLEFGARQLYAQTAAVEPLVRECVDKAAAGGIKPTGTAMLTYIVAYHGDKLEIEDVGVDNEKTTLQQDSLIDCMAQTAKEMKFAGLPRRAKAIYVSRQVSLEAGKISEYKHVSFSYLK
jgi:hypothetical protein